MLTPGGFRRKMKRLKDEWGEDEERVHGLMDNLMAELLTELGYGAGIKIFKAQRKYYS